LAQDAVQVVLHPLVQSSAHVATQVVLQVLLHAVAQSFEQAAVHVVLHVPLHSLEQSFEQSAVHVVLHVEIQSSAHAASHPSHPFLQLSIFKLNPIIAMDGKTALVRILKKFLLLLKFDKSSSLLVQFELFSLIEFVILVKY